MEDEEPTVGRGGYGYEHDHCLLELGVFESLQKMKESRFSHYPKIDRPNASQYQYPSHEHRNQYTTNFKRNI